MSDAQINAQGAIAKSKISMVVAAVGAVLYLFVSGYLLAKFALDQHLPEVTWQRILIIFNGIASIGYASIGVLLGTSVHQVSLSTARAAIADKSATIKKAYNTLTNAPGDIGGGPASEESRVAQARQVLMDALN
jgi:hypothetical protein